MIELEKKALEALGNVSMRPASAGKRFRNDLVYHMRVQPEMKLTARQALYLWKLVYTYRRQISDPDLLTPAAIAHKTDMLPDIYLLGDHREPVPPVERNGKFGGRGSATGPQTSRAAAPVQVNTQRDLFEGVR